MTTSVTDIFVEDLGELSGRRSVKWQDTGHNMISLATAEMDVLLPEPVQSAVIDCVRRGDSGYAVTDPLEHAYAEFASTTLKRSNVVASRVRSCPNVLQGIQVLLNHFDQGSHPVMVNSPVYGDLWPCVQQHGRAVEDVPLLLSEGHYTLDLPAIEKSFRSGVRSWILCNPHNPVGRAWTTSELRAALELASEYDVLLISNEVHFALSRSHTVAVSALDVHEAGRCRLLVLDSASKSFNLAGLKSAVVVSGPRMEAELDAIPQGSFGRPGILGVAAAEAAFLEGGAWLHNLRRELDRSYDKLHRWVDTFDCAVTLTEAESTYLGWLHVADGDLPRFSEALAVARVRLTPGSLFGGDQYSNYFRVNFGCHPHTLDTALMRMKASLG